MESNSIQSITDNMPSVVKHIYENNERRVYISIDPDNIIDVCLHLHKVLGGRLAIITGTDLRSGVDLLYHFMIPEEHRMISVRTLVKKPDPEIRSLGEFLPAAIWIERELFDILGVTFTGHPDFRRLIMADDWPENVYPLRRDFKEPDK